MLDNEIQKLKQKAAIQRAPSSPGFYGRVFVVPKKGGEWRPVFNLRPLNKYVAKQNFKMATVRTVASAIRPNDYAISLDLKDAYLHVPVHPAHRKFLRFCFKGKVYQFCVLPFGLSSAPRTFTKLTRVVVLYCRSLGIRIIIYLDDSLLLARPRELARRHRDILIRVIHELGFVINWSKSDLEPRQDFAFIGLLWSSRAMSVSLPQDKLDKLHHAAQGLRSSPAPTCRRVQQFLGRANFATIALPRARLHMRALQACLRSHYRSRRDLFSPCPLTQQALQDLEWWMDPPVNGVSLSPRLPQHTITTDASKFGWGAQWGPHNASGPWPPRLQRRHINLLELQAVKLALKQWAPQLRGSTVALFCDNKTVVAYLAKEGGTRSLPLCTLTRETLAIVDRWAITLRPAYLKGIANSDADALSRGQTCREWHLTHKTARRVFKRWTRPSWDLLASADSTKAPYYFSLDRDDPEAQGADAFMQSWGNLRGPIYVFPPPQLLPQVLAKVVTEEIEVMLIAPCWEDAAWLPELLALSTAQPRRLPPDAVTVGESGQPPPKAKDLRLTAWRLSGRRQRQRGQTPQWLSSSYGPSDPHHTRPTRPHGGHGPDGAGGWLWSQLPPL